MLAATVGSLLAVGCGISRAADQDGGSDGPAAPAGSAPDELTVVTSFPVDDLLPLESGYWAPELGYGDLLMRPQPGGEVEPWLLESLERTDDTTWVLGLREGVTFQNGNPLDAEVLAELVSWHVERNPAISADLAGAEATVTGPRTVELTTPEPVPNLPSLLAHEGAFVLFDLATYQDLADDTDELVGAGIYTGPYSVVRLTGDEMELAPTPGYYGGEPALSAVTVRFVPDAQARVRAVQSGEADLALYPPTAAARQLDGRSDALYLVQAEGEASAGMQLFVNQASAALADRDVRKAVQLAIDYQALADHVLDGLYDSSTGLYPAFLPYALDILETDLDEARGLLDGAGWEPGGDGSPRTRDGETLTLRLLTYPQQPDVGVAAVAVQAQLAEVGIAVEVIEADDITSALEDPTGWELGISNNSALGMTGTDPVQPLTTYYRSTGERNHGGVDDPDLDRLIDRLAVATDPGERAALLEGVQEIVVEDQAYGWFLALKRTPVVVAPALEGYTVPVANLWMGPFS